MILRYLIRLNEDWANWMLKLPLWLDLGSCRLRTSMG